MKDEIEKPSYYSIIPASVRYDQDLKANEKLLYSEITVLCNKQGICYASNNYFSKLYGVDKMTISRWIKNLREKGYILTKIVSNNNDNTSKRVIVISDAIVTEITKNYCDNNKRGIDEIVYGYIQKSLRGIDEKVYHNNTSIIYNNKKENQKENIFEYVEKGFGRLLSPTELAVIKTWDNNEVTKYAIDQAILNNKCSIKYVSKILYEYERNNITTLDQAKKREEEFSNRKGRTNSKSNYSSSLESYEIF